MAYVSLSDMKRTLRSALCVTAAGVLAGGLFYLNSSKAPVALQAEVQAAAAPVVDQIKGVLAPVETAAAKVAESVTGWVTGAAPQRPGAPVVLLSENVVILGASTGNESLPKGTPVRILKHQGAYVQVQHQSRVITIPRTAMVLGAYRPN